MKFYCSIPFCYNDAYSTGHCDQHNELKRERSRQQRIRVIEKPKNTFKAYGWSHCSGCELFKPYEDFYKKPGSGIQHYCKNCHDKYCQELNLKKKYGITMEEFTTTLIGQGFKCKLCPKEILEYGGKDVHVDHNHETGLFRGILCMRCNIKLSYLEEPGLKEALEYLGLL